MSWLCIWMDGELVPSGQSVDHFLMPSLHYGTRVFEGNRGYETDKGSAVFRMREHLQRF